MKHVIVICTVDDERGVIDHKLQSVLERAVQIGVEEAGHGPCYTQSAFNERSAIAATHKMFHAPEWKGDPHE